MWGRLCFVNVVNLLCNTFRKIFWFDTKYKVPYRHPTMNKPFYGSSNTHATFDSLRNLQIANCSHKAVNQVISALTRLRTKPSSKLLLTK